MLRIYADGYCKDGVYIYRCIAHHSEFERRYICGILSGFTCLEDEINVLGIALKYVDENACDDCAVIYSTFEQATSYAAGKWKNPQLQRAREFVRYVRKVKGRRRVEFTTDTPADLEKSLKDIHRYVGDKPTINKNAAKGTYHWIILPSFEIKLYDRNGNLLCHNNHRDYEENLVAAIRFCRYYEKESKDEKSYYSGCRLETTGIPNIEIED